MLFSFYYPPLILKTMNIEVNDKGIIELREVFVGIKFITKDGEELHICMRDSGFEITYENEWYELKEGEVKKLEPNKTIEDNELPTFNGA